MTLFARLRKFAWNAPPRTPLDAGIAALERRRVDEALAHFADALAAAATDADRAAAHNKRGVALVQRGDRDAAIDAFIAAIEAEPAHVPAVVNVGNLLLETGALDDAVAHYESALRHDDDYAIAHLNLGVAYKKLGRRSEAVREFRRANRLERRLKLRF